MTELDILMAQHGWTRRDLEKAAAEIAETRTEARNETRFLFGRLGALKSRLPGWRFVRARPTGIDTGTRAV